MSATSLAEGPAPSQRTRTDREFDWRGLNPVAAGLEAALVARAPTVHVGTPLVRKLAAQAARLLGLDEQDRMAVDICARVRDIGMISLPDYVILNAGALSAGDQVLLNRHPVIGSELLQSLSTMAAAAAIVRGHHERWDGAGYPDGLRGEAIPLASRVVAVCDAFVTLASDRPDRRGVGAEGALEYVRRHRGSQFDPRIADCLVAAITGKDEGPRRALARDVDQPDERQRGTVHGAPARVRDLRSALARFDVVPAFAPACDRALAAPAIINDRRSELVRAIENDIGLTLAVLRRAQEVPGHTDIANVTDAVAALRRDEITSTIASLPRAAFPWHTSFDALLLRCRLHSLSVARAVERLASMTRPFETENLVAAALLHDVGKLLLARARPDYVPPSAARCTPEERARQEQRELGVDHASLGGLLLERWGLPEGLVNAVFRHHRAKSAGEPASLVRLGDMVAHHAQGNAVDRSAMLQLAADWELPLDALRDAVFDQPQALGPRRRAERSPLSSRETEVLRLVADGKRDTDIAADLHLSVSTVRSHLHNVHAKLEVASRTQAVIRAAEMAWI